MKKLTEAETLMIQERISLFAAFCLDEELAALLERYVEVSRPQWDGTADAILPHFMSLEEIRKGKVNLRYLCGVAERILEIRKLAQKHIAHEAGLRTGKVSA